MNPASELKPQAPVSQTEGNPGAAVAQLMMLRFGRNWQLFVPRQIRLLTPYVLLEQERWFEYEMKFVTSWLKPGMRVIDVGANHGVYTVPIAKIAGPTGQVWAFEPCQQTFDRLRRSARHNSLSNTAVIKSAVGAELGMVRLATGENSEMNQISDDLSGASEWVDLTTLDHCAAAMHFGDVDFIKLDAEGYEVEVIKGAKRLLKRCSPLIMFEFKHNDTLNVDLLEVFQSMAYQIYVLVPGINTLIPYCQSQHNDALLINLFAVKDDQAQSMHDAGYLMQQVPTGNAARLQRVILDDQSNRSRASLTGATSPDSRQQKTDDCYVRAATLTLAAENTDLPKQLRLEAALSASSTSAMTAPDAVWHQALLARLSMFFGNRSAAATTSASLLPRIRLRRQDPPDYVLPACDRYDSMDFSCSRRDWFAASVHECFESARAYSSYMLGSACLANLEVIDSLGFLSREFERRRQLIHRCFGSGLTPAVPDTLLQESDENQNFDFWRQQQLADRTKQ